MVTDPFLLSRPIARYQLLWQIHAHQAPLDQLLGLHDMDPLKMLRHENKQVQEHYKLIRNGISFLRTECSGIACGFWASVSSVALPWPLPVLYPRMPQKDGICVDYVIMYFKYKTLGAAMCFWSDYSVNVPTHLGTSEEEEESTSSIGSAD